VGSNTKVSGEGGPGLLLGEVTLPEMLGQGYATALIGKWHLLDVSQGPVHPLDSGYGYHAGTLFNLGGDYYSWDKVTNGVPSTSTVYATTDSVNEAAAWIQSAPEPWLMVVCFNAAHGPLDPPPRDLHTLDLERADEPTLGRAIVQAMDTEIGRLLDSIEEDVRSNTTVFFLADNGSSESVTTPPFDPEHTKTSVYEGGINVPLIVAGPHVRRPGAFSNALVSVVDVFETVREIAGAGPTELPTDGVSLVPYFHDPYQPSLRATVYSEVFRPNGPPLATLHHKQAIRDERYKLINRVPGKDEFFDLWLDPFEQHNLLQGFTTGAQQAALGRLLAALPENRSSGGCTTCD
jgi:arylsulfatase A-like enzyme